MSRDLFSEEGLDLTFSGEREHYEPGKDGFDRGLVDVFVGMYLDDLRRLVGTHQHKKLFKENVERFTVILDDIVDSEFNANIFIDAVVDGIALRLDEEGSENKLTNLGQLVDPLVQSLYNLGHNNFAIDGYSLPCYPTSLGSYLMGTKKAPLVVAYRADTGFFGHKVRNCSLTLVGNVFRAGAHSHDSEFHFEGDSQQVGYYSSNCSFYVKGMQFLPRGIDSPETPRECEFYVDMHMTRARVREFRSTYFFENRNRLFHPKGDGWEEVFP